MTQTSQNSHNAVGEIGNDEMRGVFLVKLQCDRSQSVIKVSRLVLPSCGGGENDISLIDVWSNMTGSEFHYYSAQSTIAK